MASGAEEGQEQGFLSHLIELRDRLLRMVIAVGLVFVCLFPFAKDLFNILAQPLIDQVPAGMLVTTPVGPFLVPMKLALLVAFFMALPYVLYQLWSFVAPGLYRHEKRLIVPLLVSSVLLFYLGALFAYLVLLPLMFTVLPSFVPEVATYSPDIGSYLDFVMAIFMAFGIGFEMPIATILLITTGMTTREDLARKRPYVIVVAFTVGMLLTPPDVLSQIVLAVPMWLLFEAGLVASRLFEGVIEKSRNEREAREAAERAAMDTEYADEAGRAADFAVAPESPAAASEGPVDFLAQATASHRAAQQGAATQEPAAGPVADNGTADKPATESDAPLWEDERYTYEDSPLQHEKTDAYRPLTDEELEAEMARIEAEEAERAAGKGPSSGENGGDTEQTDPPEPGRR